MWSASAIGQSSQTSTASANPIGVASYVSSYSLLDGHQVGIASNALSVSKPLDRLQVAVGSQASPNPFGIASYVSAPLPMDQFHTAGNNNSGNMQKLMVHESQGITSLIHSFKVGDDVEIWSSSQQKWRPGKVDRVEGELLSVMYRAPDGQQICKVLKHGDTDIRCIVDAATPHLPVLSGSTLLASRVDQSSLSKLPHMFKLGDDVEIWSRSQQIWCRGKIDRVEGPLVSVQYAAPDGSQIYKVMDNGDQNIRHAEQRGLHSLSSPSLAAPGLATNDGPSKQLDKDVLQSGTPPGEAEIALVLDAFRGRADFGNAECADCGAPQPEWASLKEGTLICLDCAGVHRCLGLPLQSMARPEVWKASDALQFCGHGGNTKANKRLAEYAGLEAPRPPPDMDRGFIERFIVRKHNGSTFFQHGECVEGSRALVRDLAQKVEKRRLAKEKAEREAREAAERKRREQAEKAARELAIWEAKKAAREKAQREAREAAERARREQAEKVLRDLAAREAEAQRLQREQAELALRSSMVAQVPSIGRVDTSPRIGEVSLSPPIVGFQSSAGAADGLVVVDVVAVNLFKERVADLRFMGSWFLNLTVVLSLGKISALATSSRKGSASVRWEPPEQRELRWDCKQRWLWCRVNDNMAGGGTQLAGVGVVDVRAAQLEASDNGTGIRSAEMELELLANEPKPSAGLGDLIFLDACQVKPAIMLDADFDEIDTDPKSRKANAACWMVSVGKHGPPGPPGGHGHYMFEQVEDLDHLTNGQTCGTVILRISVHDPSSVALGQVV